MEWIHSDLAYRLLINVNISEDKQRLARATMGNLTYVNMKKQLRAIQDCDFNDSVLDEEAKVKLKRHVVMIKQIPDRDMFFSTSNKKG